MFCRHVFGNISGGFHGISRFFGISRVRDRAKYQKPCIGNVIGDLLYFSDFYSLNGHGPRRSYSSSPESAAGQVLTLADLSPAGSEPNLPSKGRVLSTPLISSSQPLRSSYPDLRNGSSHLSPRDQEVHLPRTNLS